MAASRVLVAMAAESVATVQETVTLPQLRVLVMAASRTPLSLAAVARSLKVHPSNATRTVDKLVAEGYLRRDEDPADRRQVRLALTDAGQALVEAVNDHRRESILRVVEAMPPRAREQLTAALEAFAAAAGELDHDPVSLPGGAGPP